MRILSMAAVLLMAALTAQAQPGDQSAAQFGLSHLTEYLALKPEDISFRPDYTEPDSFRLAKIAHLMQHPLEMIDYSAVLKDAYVSGQPEVVSRILFEDLKMERQTSRQRAYNPDVEEMQKRFNLYYASPSLNQLLTRAALYIDVIFPKSSEQMLSELTPQQRRFLTNEFKELLVTRVEEENYTVEQIDSTEKAEEAYAEEFVEFGWKIKKDPIIRAGIDCLQDLLLELANVRRELDSGDKTVADIMKGFGAVPKGAERESYIGMQPGWVVGGPGNDYYEGQYRVIFDFGGDDIYDLFYDPTDPHGVIIIDLGGDDHYRGKTDFAVASGCLSVGLLLDFGGNDRYDTKSFAQGSGFFGFGLLYDADGDDRYDGDTHVQAASSFGLGLLIDEGGRDIYNAALYSQGFGFVEGMGVIYDIEGSDSYYAGGKYKDILRYEDHYLSLSQGFGYGLRPWMSGGIGAIIDKAGNDSYYSDIFAQGTSYWWSLGLIYDSSGNDNFQAFQYAQGCGTHMTLGALIDDAGDDVYFGKGLMQGVGHDYSCGLLIDRGGNDVYTAFDLSQAAGSANGVGVLIDTEGDDRYFVKNPDNTHGYGNPRRSFGSIGLFIDLGGDDLYTGKYGRNNHYWMSESKWGGGMDIERNPPETAEAGEDK